MLWRPQCKVEILSAAGVFRVTLTPQLNAFLVVITAVFLAVGLIGWQQWPEFFQHQRTWSFIFGFGFGCSILCGIWYQIAGSEEIGISRQRLMVRKNHPIWPKTWEAPLQECSRLAIRKPDEPDSDMFSCRLGGKKVTFGAGMSQEQAETILIELQRNLPEAADRLLSNADDPFGKHFTVLKLS